MAWNEQRARRRIADLQESAPATDITVRDLDAFFAERTSLQRSVLASGRRFEEPIFAIPRNRAVTTHGVHVYANLMDYTDHQTERGRETEAGHARAMQSLHAHYGACDQLIAEFGIQRVDFHGPRLHAVVLAPTGAANEQARIEIAISFAAAFRDMVLRLAALDPEMATTRIRVGIDSGPAVAVNSGRRGELEPLFIGSPANHAAKAADGDQPGIFFGPRVRQLREAAVRLGTRSISGAGFADSAEELGSLAKMVTGGIADGRASVRMEAALAAYRHDRAALAKVHGASEASFSFHYHQPPLRTISYADHPPSNAIRMALASLFADIDGFTRYIDNAITNGQVAQAVSNLHVMRGEMNYVVRDDFGGRKVRYIGDCLHALIAEGDERNIDESETVRSAVLAAAGIYSSFELCRASLPGADELRIAIGIELGTTPIARLGLRGDASVRCASSKATCISEEVQRACAGGEIGLGPSAYAAGDVHLRRLFDTPHHKVGRLSHGSASTLLLGASAAVITPTAAVPRPIRAYGP